MEQNPLPERQKAVYDFIERYHTERGIAPSLQDIADFLRVSVTAARAHVETLKAKGYVAATKGVRRSLRIAGDGGKPGFAQGAE
jgi:SOS-response transcriptional repressor LexA